MRGGQDQGKAVLVPSRIMRLPSTARARSLPRARCRRCPVRSSGKTASLCAITRGEARWPGVGRFAPFNRFFAIPIAPGKRSHRHHAELCYARGGSSSAVIELHSAQNLFWGVPDPDEGYWWANLAFIKQRFYSPLIILGGGCILLIPANRRGVRPSLRSGVTKTMIQGPT
jgi:hypothetical protein